MRIDADSLDVYMIENNLTQFEVAKSLTSNFSKEIVEVIFDNAVDTIYLDKKYVLDIIEYKYLLSEEQESFLEFDKRLNKHRANYNLNLCLSITNFNSINTIFTSKVLIPTIQEQVQLTHNDYLLRIKEFGILPFGNILTKEILNSHKDEDFLLTNSKVTEELLLNKRDVKAISNNIITLRGGRKIRWIKH